MNKNKKIFIITLTFLMLVGLTAISATDTNDTTTLTETSQAKTIDTTTQTNTANDQTTITKEVSASQTDNIQENIDSYEIINDKSGGKTQNLKAGSRTVTATNYTNLNSYLTNGDYDTVTINIGDDIQLAGSITVNSIIKNLTINGNGKTIDGYNKYRFLSMDYTNVLIKNITITHCNNNDYWGGAIRIGYDSNITVTDSNLTNNNVNGIGGAIYGTGSCNVTIIRSNFINNNATNGGAIYGFDNINIINSTLSYNNATEGGAIRGFYNVSIIDSLLLHNNATYGGAIYGDPNSIITITQSNLNYNNATNRGGVICGRKNSTIIVTNSNLTNNNAHYGGAIYGDTNNNITVTSSNLTNNNAHYGGAIYGEENSIITITQSNLNYNNATNHGGAIYGNINNITVTSSNLTNNNAYYGGAICGNANNNITVTSSNLTNNNASYGGAIRANTNSNLTVQSSNFKDNYVTSKSGFVVDFNRADNVKITDSTFTNNTDNTRDMLFSESKTGASVDIHGNNYIDNYLATNITKLGNVNVNVLDDVTYNYTVNVTVRSIYNHTINNGTVYVRSDNIDGYHYVSNNQTNITVRNVLLDKAVNNISYNYTSLSKYYQTAKASFEIYKHVPTYLNITFNTTSEGVNVGDTVRVTVTLTDVDGNRLRGREIGIRLNGMSHSIPVNTTDVVGQVSFDYTVPGIVVNGRHAEIEFEAEHHETDPESYYDSAETVEKTLLIYKNSTHIHIEYPASEAIIGNTFNVTITLCDNQVSHSNISGQTVHYNITTINGILKESGSSTRSEGFNVTINEIPEEGYIVNAWFDETNEYIGSAESEKIVPGKMGTQTEVIVSKVTVYVNQTNLITVKILDSEGNPIPDESVVWISINNQEATPALVMGGEYKFNYSSPFAGLTNITATFHDTSIYSRSSGTGDYNVTELPTHTTLVHTSTKVENTTIIAYINDTINNKPVNGGTINITENGRLLQTVEVVNGTAVFTLRGLTAGEHDLQTYYSGVPLVYDSSEQDSKMLDIEKTHTNITVEPVSVLISDTQVNITVKVVDEFNKAINGTVNIKVGNTIINNQQINNGTATLTISNLQTAGTYTIEASFNEDETYYSSNYNGTLTVNKIPTQTQIEILDNTIGNITIKVNVTNTTGDKVLTGNITLLNEYDQEIPTLVEKPLNNGETIITLPFTLSADLKLKVRYNENNIYYESYALNQTGGDTINIPIKKIPTITTADILNNTLGNVTLKITVTNKTGEKVNQGTITVLNNYNMPITGLNNIPLINGEATIKVPSQTAGENLLLTVHYNENDVYNASNAENKSLSVDDPKYDKIDIIVNKIPTITTADILNNTLGNVTIHITVTNSTGDKVTKGTVTVLNNSNNPISGLEDVTLENGEIRVNIPSSKAGENITIAVRYNENDIYNCSIATNDSQGNPLTITVQPHDSELTAIVINGTIPTVEVNLTDDAGEAIPNAPIIITDENGTVIANGTTDENGTTTIPVPLPTGDHNITVSYPGDNNHKAANKTVPVTVEKHNTTLNVTPENGTVIVNATNENGTPIPNLPINITDENGTVIANGTTDENGTVIIPVPLEPGDHNITITTQGDENNTGTNTTIPITIPPKDTNMTINVTNGSNPIVKVNLTDDEGKPIPNAPIIITDENGTEIANGTTDENGTTTIPVPLPTGENNITVSYPGNDTYKPQEETVTVNATPKESKTSGTVTNNTVGNVTIDVQVVDPETGKPVTGPVKIIIDGDVVGNGTLNDEGKTTIPIDIDKKGNYTIVVEYEGNDDYNGSNDTLNDINIVGKDVNVTIVVDNPTVGNTTVNITITDPETNTTIPNATVIITLPNGTNVTGITDENGSISIPIDVPSGDNNITITYPGDDEHESQQENITIRVKSYTIVTVEPVEGVTLDNVTFTANVRDYQNNPVTGGYVQFSVGGKTLKDENGKNIRVLVENGIAKLSYKAENGWIVDSHPDLKVQAVFTGTSLARENRSDTNKVTIYKRNATVQVSAPDDYVNGTLHIDAEVRDQNGSLINDGLLVFKLNGLSLKDENNKGIVAKVVNGKVHLDVKLPFAYSAKKYNLTAVYSNKIYNKATGTNTTSLKAIPTYVNASVTIKDQFSKPVVTGQIYNKFNNAILEGTAIINIKFDGISYAKKVKVENGTFRETLEGIPIYKPGTHKVEIAAGANSHYEAARKTITSKTTPKYNVNTVITNITRNKTTTRVQAKIVDDKNKNVQKDLRITIKLNGKSFLVNQTVRNGKVDVLVDTSTLKNRTYNLEIVSGANTYYNAGKATAELPKY